MELADDRGRATHLVVLALLTLNLALHGHQLGARGIATLLVLFSVVGAALALWSTRQPGAGPFGLRGLVALGVSVQVLLLGLATVDAVAPTAIARSAAASGWILIAAGAVGLVARDGPEWRPFGLVLMAGMVVCGLAWLTGPVTIDVLTFQEVAAARLADGQNPYVGPYPHPYAEQEVLEFWTEDRVLGDSSLRTGFPYLPASLLLSSLATWLFGDPRVAHLGAAVGSVWLLLRSGRATSHLAAALLGSTPLLLFVVQQAWTEAFVIVAVVAVVVLPGRATRARGWATGLLAALKQYAALLAVVHHVLLRRSGVMTGASSALRTAAAVFLAVTLPFALWNPQAFIDSVVGVHVSQRYRPDSLSLLAAFDRTTGTSLEEWSLVLTVAAVGLTLLALARWAPRTHQGVAVGVALVFVALLAFARQAHVNYWMVVVATLAAAVAVAPGGAGSPDVGRRRGATAHPADRLPVVTLGGKP